MRRLICVSLLLVFSHKTITAADKPSMEVLTPLVRLQLVSLISRNIFEIEECPVEGLWEEMEMCLLKVGLPQVRLLDLGDDGSGDETVYLLYHEGGFVSFVHSNLMSAVVVGGKLYYSYFFVDDFELACSSCTSSPVVCVVGQLTIEDGQLSSTESEYRSDALFLTNVKGRVQVQSGDFEKFNSWTEGAPVGWLELEQGRGVEDGNRVIFDDLKFVLAEPSQQPRLAIVDDFGDEVLINTHHSDPWTEAAQPGWIVGHGVDGAEVDGDEFVTRFEIETPPSLNPFISVYLDYFASFSGICVVDTETPADFNQPLGECKPRECWIDLRGDEEHHLAALFSILE